MLKNIIFFVILVSNFIHAQILDPVKWSSSVKKINDTELELVITAKIDNGWHLYSQFTPEGGVLPLEFKYKESGKDYILIGKTKEGKYKKAYSDVFEIDEYYFENSAQFTQKVKIANPKLQKIKLNVEGQACIEGKCVNTSSELEFVVPKMFNETVQIKKDSVKKDNSVLVQKETITEKKDSVQSNYQNSVPNKSIPINKNKSLWSIFILAFLGGFSALFTPCVFPMIPMTVSFFLKRSGSRSKGIINAFIYGLSIIVIYVLLGTVITTIFGDDALNRLSTSVIFNLFFFVLIIVFAISFLGAFEIVLPASLATAVDKQADKGGVLGIFFMALALAIVSFSCTGPIVGPLLVQSTTSGGFGPAVGMLGFSLALAIPFVFFALFPNLLKSLPKSGGWLNTVKVSLGFLELAFALKFLSNADLVTQSHYITREVFISLWVAIFVGWALYLFGVFQLPHDDKLEKLSVGRTLLALLVSAFAVYLIPGLLGAPLKIVSGIIPPSTYVEGTFGGSSMSKNEASLPKGSKFGPHGIIAFEDYEEGLAYAKSVNKPVLLDFTGDACANCRLMEDRVWSKPEILSVLKNELVLISLYCDRKIELPKENQYFSKTRNKQIVTIGDKWTDFQVINYQSNSQPLYVIKDVDGNDINLPIGYETDDQVYLNWLKDAINKAKK